MGDARCLFCGGGPLTREHAIPQWLGELLPDRGVSLTHIGDDQIPRPRGVHQSAATTQVKAFCASCNNGWMIGLETAAGPFVGRMALGHGVSLDETAQQIVASWTLKTALVFMLSASSEEWQKLRPLYSEYYADRQPPISVRISIAASASDKWCTFYRLQPLIIESRDATGSIVATVDCQLVTIGVGHFVAQLIHCPLDPSVGRIKGASHGYSVISPYEGEFIWPRGILTDTSVEASAFSSFPDRPNPN